VNPNLKTMWDTKYIDLEHDFIESPLPLNNENKYGINLLSLKEYC
jgi:hypothetical protein